MSSDGPTPTRKIARQATSAASYVADEPDEDDPLLALAHRFRRRFRSDSASKL